MTRTHTHTHTHTYTHRYDASIGDDVMNAALRRQQALREGAEGHAETLAEPLTPVDEAGFIRLNTPLSSSASSAPGTPLNDLGTSGPEAAGCGGAAAPTTPTQEVDDAARKQRAVAKRAYSLHVDEMASKFPLLSLMSEETRLACLSAVRFRAFTKGQRILRRGEESD